jgi:hypothetical protein
MERPETAYTGPDDGGAKNGERGTSTPMGCNLPPLQGPSRQQVNWEGLGFGADFDGPQFRRSPIKGWSSYSRPDPRKADLTSVQVRVRSSRRNDAFSHRINNLDRDFESSPGHQFLVYFQ